MFSYNLQNENEKNFVLSLIHNLQLCKIKLNLLNEAIKYCKSGYKFDKTDIKSVYRLAFCNYQLNKINDSKYWIEIGINLDPKDIQIIELNEKIKEKYDFETQQLLKDLLNN